MRRQTLLFTPLEEALAELDGAFLAAIIKANNVNPYARMIDQMEYVPAYLVLHSDGTVSAAQYWREYEEEPAISFLQAYDGDFNGVGEVIGVTYLPTGILMKNQLDPHENMEEEDA